RMPESEDRTQRRPRRARRDHEQKVGLRQDQAWVNTNTLCLVAYTSADQAESAFRKYQAQYCPRVPVNHAELQRAIAEETEKSLSGAPRRQVLFAVQTICRRFANLSVPCQTMIERLAASGD